MKYECQYTFNQNNPFNLNYVKNMCYQHPGENILIEVQSTKGITSSMIRQLDPNVSIRIVGGYDEERIERYKYAHFGRPGGVHEDVQAYYYKSVIYTRDETIKILEEIEKIEEGINENWSDIEKVIYIYDRIKTGVMYDPKFERRSSKEVRSLRGLITKQTVCAGYATIFKEFMDRNNIECEFVRGETKRGRRAGHAWNIVTVDGKKYPIDLTWDNTKFRSGESRSFEWLGKDIHKFSRSHHPAPGEKTQNYERTLSQIDQQLIKQIYAKIGIGRARDYNSTTYEAKRKDGSKFIVAQIGNDTIDNVDYYRYYYVEIAEDGKERLPLILYSDTNLTHLIDCKNFGKPIPPGYEEAVANILFSKENIIDSIKSKGTFYIGRVRKNSVGNKFEAVSSYKEIPKPEKKRMLFTYPTRIFKRSDGTVFIVQQMFDKPHKVKGVNIMRYDIFEMVDKIWNRAIKRNTVFTEGDIISDKRPYMADLYLSRERLDRKVNESGGYIGHYDENGRVVYNPDLVEYYGTAKRIDMNLFNR